MKHSSEPFWWSVFSAGGVVSALFLPVLVLVTGLVLPLQAARRGSEPVYEHYRGLVSWWPVQVVLFVVILLSFFHAAHRIRHIVMDLGWRHRTAVLSVLCYGGAAAGGAAAAYLLIRL